MALQRRFKVLAALEGDVTGSGDADALSGPGVSADMGTAMVDAEGAEAGQGDDVFPTKSVSETGEKSIQGALGSGLRGARATCESRYQLGLVQGPSSLGVGA